MANKPNGNLTGIKSAMLDRLKSLYDFKQGLDEFASFELLSELCACSGEINREISVYISRDGSIVDVSVGDSAKVSMPSMRLAMKTDSAAFAASTRTQAGTAGFPELISERCAQ